MNNQNLLNLMKELRNPETGIIYFAEKVLGLPVSKHPGQIRWLQNSKKTINILRPGNKYGKSLIGAVKHLYHAATKINLQGTYNTVEEWEQIKYDTLNFGPGYEQAREILRMARDVAQGLVHIPTLFQAEYGVMNNSLLKDWFITHDGADASQLPHLETAFGVDILGRSYDEMGGAFKMKGIAYLSGDEVADIPELWTFTNGTLLPRGAAFKNFAIDYYGTPQSGGLDYMRMIEMAEEEMQNPDWEKEGMFYVQKGSMLDNPFLDRETLEKYEKINDPLMRQQVIMGEYIESGDKYFGFERIQNSIDPNLKLIDKGFPGRKYLISVDFAGGESYWADFTVILVIDYTEEPYRVVYFNRFKGGDIPIPMQYKLVEEIFLKFRDVDTENNLTAFAKLIIDSSALGGKNALQFLRKLNPIQFDMNPQPKAEMLASLKIAFDGGNSDMYRRKLKTLEDGTVMEENPTWGLIRLPDIPVLVNELQNYKLDDKKIRTDCVMALGVPIHYLEIRRPKKPKNRMVSFDILAS